MKSFLVVAASLCLAQAAALAADTAYTALRVVGKANGKGILDQVVELRGRSGAPEPAVWKIVLDDPKARGGVRELEVQRGQIIAERSPSGRALGARMNFNQLNLDSEGAFTIANQEAQKAGVPFDRVDYVLKSGTNAGAPIWELQLMHAGEGRVATLQIAADSGTVLLRDGLDRRVEAYPRRSNRPRPPPPPPPGDEEIYPEDRDYEDEDPRYARDGAEPVEPIRDIPSFFRRLEKRVERRGQQFKRFFVGE